MYSYILSLAGICWPSFLRPSVPNERTVTKSDILIQSEQTKQKNKENITKLKEEYKLTPDNFF